MNCRMVVGNKRLKRVEMSDCTIQHGFRLVLTGYIPKEKTNDLSLLLATLLEKDSLSTGPELQRFKKRCREEGLIVWETTFFNYEIKSELNSEELEGKEVISITTYFHMYRTPKRWFNER